jgi:hypothetical protein
VYKRSSNNQGWVVTIAVKNKFHHGILYGFNMVKRDDILFAVGCVSQERPNGDKQRLVGHPPTTNPPLAIRDEAKCASGAI